MKNKTFTSIQFHQYKQFYPPIFVPFTLIPKKTILTFVKNRLMKKLILLAVIGLGIVSCTTQKYKEDDRTAKSMETYYQYL